MQVGGLPFTEGRRLTRRTGPVSSGAGRPRGVGQETQAGGAGLAQSTGCHSHETAALRGDRRWDRDGRLDCSPVVSPAS